MKEDKKLSDSEHEDIFLDTDNGLDDSVVADENQINTIKKLRERLKLAETDKQEYLTGWQKDKADFINLRKKDEEEKNEFIKFANKGIVEDIIPILDSFEQAFGNKSSWEKASEEWRKGIESIYTQLTTVLSKKGLEKFNPINETFDPRFHEAVGVREVLEDSLDHKIVEVLQTGYKIHDKIIRTAKVLVGERKST